MRRATWVVLHLVAVLPAAQGSVARAADAPAPEPPSDFRRIYAPADRAQDWPFRAERYLPIDADEFEGLVDRAQGTSAPPVDAAIAEVKLTATYDGGERLTGTAELTLRPASAAARLVPLANFGVVVEEAKWKGGAEAVVGTTSDGTAAVWVEKADTLLCRWSLRGVRDAAGGLVFDLGAPPAAVSSLALALPTTHALQVDGTAATAEGPATATARTHVLRPFGERRRLRIVAAAKAAAPLPPAVRQDVDYEYSERGIDVTAQLRIDAVDESLRTVTVEIDPSLTVVDARLAERRLTWNETTTTNRSQPKRVELSFDPPLFGAGRTVMLRALSPSNLDKRQKLPAVRCPDLDWRQGTMSLAVSSPLVVTRIDPSQCSVSTPTPLAGERPGEAYEFTCFDPQASASVLVSAAREALEATSVTNVSFGDEEATADHRVELRATAGERFLVQAGLPSRWLVDSVTSIPAGAVADWTLSPVSDKRRWLTLRLAQALRPDRPLRLSIVVRSSLPGSGAELTADDLRIVEFRDAEDDEPTAAVASSEAFRLELVQERDESAPSVERLDPLRRELLADFPAEYLLDLQPSAEPWRLRLGGRAARIEADVDVTATAAATSLTERYRFRLTNLDDSPIDRVQLRFQPGRTQPIQWTPKGDRRVRIEARRVTRGDAKPDDGGGEWEIAFPVPIDDVVEFEALRRVPLTEVSEVALVSVIGAETQRGTVTVETDAATPVIIDHTSLTPLAADDSREATEVVRGRYQFEPEEDVAQGVPPRLILRRVPNSAENKQAVVWRAELRAAYDADHRARYSQELRIQSFGAERFTLRLPDEARRIALRVDDAPLDVRSSTVEVPLPPDREFVVVTTSYEIEPAGGGPLRLVDAGRLDVDLPVLSLSRAVEVPPEFEVLDRESRSESPWEKTARLVRPILAPRFAALFDEPRLDADAAPVAAAKQAASPWLAAVDDAFYGAATQHRTLWSIRRETSAALCFLAFVLGVVLTYTLTLGRRGAFWFALAATAAAATLPSADAARFPAFAFLGICLAGIVNVAAPRIGPRTRFRAGRAGGDASRLGSSLTRAVPLLLAAVTACSAATAIGQVTTGGDSRPVSAIVPAATAPAQAPAVDVPAVFIPVDDDGRPTGERYLVPERLWKSLRERLTSNDPTTHHSSVILKSEYVIGTAFDARQGRYIVSQIEAAWTVEALRDDAEAIIPFRPFADGAAALSVDGRPVDVVRSVDGRRLHVALEKAGRRRIEAVARVTAETTPTGTLFTFAVPRTLDTQVTIVSPPELAGPTVVEALAAPTYSEDRRTAVVRTAPTNQITVSWNEAPSTGPPEVEQFELWRIRPGTVTVDVKLRFAATAQPLRELTYFADPRLQWLPRRTAPGDVVDVAAQPLVVEQATVGQRLRWTLPENADPAAPIEASFLLSGATGAGRMRLPELRPDGLPLKRRVFAVVVDPSIEYSFAGSQGTITAAIPEFERVWGVTTSLPQGAFERVGPTNDWSVTLKPKPTQLDAVEVQTLTCGSRRIEIGYEATVAATGDAVTRHEIVVPPSVAVESVSAVDADGEETVARWSRDDAGAVIAFLRAPLRGEHRLSLRGRLNLGGAGEIPFPFVQLRKSDGERRLRIVRLPEVTTKLVAAKQLKVEPQPAAVEVGRGRLESVWRVDGPDPTARLQLRPNKFQAAARVVAAVRRDSSNWEHELTAQLEVKAGLLDEIRLDLPASISTPLTVIPAMPYEVSALRDGGRRLVLRPREAIQGAFQFTLRSGLTTLDREHPVPFVRLRQITVDEYYYLLPARSGLNRVDWEVEQLIAAEPPKGFQHPATEEVVTFRAVGQRPAAVLRDVRRGVGRPYVRLADHLLRITSQGDQGVTTLLVEPSGAGEFALRMPPGTEPLRVRAGGADMALTTAADGSYRLPAASEQLPHVIEILYRRPYDGRRQVDQHTFAAPSLEGLTVSKTLCTIEAADVAIWQGFGRGESKESSVVAERVRAYDAVLAELSVDDGLGVVGHWAAPLAERRRLAMVDLERLTPVAVDTAAAPIPLVDVDAQPRFYLDQVWSAAGDAGAQRRFLMIDGDAGSFELSPQASIHLAAAMQFAAPCLCALIAVAGYLASRRDGAYRWLQPLCAATGVLWLTFFQPEIVGWLLIATAVGSRLHPSLRKARERRAAAPVALRLSR